jgi:polyferredoxin
VTISRTTLSTLRFGWIALCLWVLLYAWQNRSDPTTDEAVLWAMIVLTFPIALTLATVGMVLFIALDKLLGVVVPGGFGFNAVFWVLSFALGYWFWFVFMPKVVANER